MKAKQYNELITKLSQVNRSVSEELVREDIEKLNQNSEEIKKLKKDYNKHKK